MARKLKTFTTNLGFFELAVAAPSMKAALEAWGLTHNAFRHGFAKPSSDPKIIAAAEAKPGIVLRRPIGSSAEFGEQAALPTVRPAKKPAMIRSAPKGKHRTGPKQKPQPRSSAAARRKVREEKPHRAQAGRNRRHKAQAIRAAEKALVKACARHENAIAKIDRHRSALDELEEKENVRWEKERRRLDAAVRAAKEGSGDWPSQVPMT